MKAIFSALILSALAAGQTTGTVANPDTSSAPATSAKTATLTIPGGTKVPLALKQAISTKGSREGDAVYAETTFPVVQEGKILIPAGTYVQGRISHIQRAGRVKGRAEVLFHFTTLIYPNGYTVMLPGSVENIPGADKTTMKDPEGTIRQDGQTGQKVGTIASTGATGAVIGGLAGQGAKGTLIGAGVGGAVGTAIALLSRGNDVTLDNGTSVEMVIQRQVTLDPARIPMVVQNVAH